MDLKEYVTTVLTQISDAVTECNHSDDAQSMRVNPCLNGYQVVNNDVYEWAGKYEYNKVVNINFDIAVSISTDKENGGKIGLNVFECGGGKKTEQSEVNRVSFSLPVILPTAKKKI